MVALIALSMVVGCKGRVDPILSEIDFKMEEHPDSALMLLDSYRLSDNTSDYDRAYYGLLLTHARYKNFIDETNDSLISASADYFLKHNCQEQAARSLFLQGMIQMNANRFGEAAVSFSKGLDIAKDSKQYMWEGQCARGLFMLYGYLLDGSAQLKYAEEAISAFDNGNYGDWKNYAQFNLARAYNNNGQYEKSLCLIEDLLKNTEEMDTSMLSELYQLKGLSLFAVGRYEESIKNYKYAYKFNPLILSDQDKYNISFSLFEIDDDSLYLDDDFIEMDNKNKFKDVDAFIVLARQGNYKQAYKCLEHYKNLQDSVMSVILKNNVYESMHQYEEMKETLYQARVKNVRMLLCIAFLCIIIVCMMAIWKMRERIHKENSLCLKMEADLESLRFDLQTQLMKTGMMSENSSIDSIESKFEGFERIIKQRYAEVNRLCDDYYPHCDRNDDKKGIKAEANKVIMTFSEKYSLEEIEKFVDEKSDGLYTSFKKVFFDFSEDEHRLFLYLMLGFNSRTISVILGQKVSAVYNKKSRLKGKIEKSRDQNKQKYLRFF